MCSESSLKILIVDGDDFDRETYRRYLSDKFIVLEATSASDALNICRTKAIDLILLDFLLPDGDGLALLEGIKTILKSLHPPIVMITGQGSESIAVRALKQGAED
ncbi:MAG: histidine kinase, partial [Leptolyngbya sp. ERB_1_2]